MTKWERFFNKLCLKLLFYLWQSHRSRTENHLLQPAGYTSFYAAQDEVEFTAVRRHCWFMSKMPSGNTDLYFPWAVGKMYYSSQCNEFFLKEYFGCDRFLLGHLANTSALERKYFIISKPGLTQWCKLALNLSLRLIVYLLWAIFSNIHLL